MLKRLRAARGEIIMLAAFTALVILIFGVQVYTVLPFGDYSTHRDFARGMVEDGVFVSVHILFQTLVIGLRALAPISWNAAGWFVSVGFSVLTALILYRMIRSGIGATNWRSRLLAMGMALSMLLVAPVNLLTLPEKNLYFGYVGINVAHSPTMVMLKPFALLVFVFTVGVLSRAWRLSARTVVIGWLLVAICLFAKPVYVLTLLPALGLVLAYRLLQRDYLTVITGIAALAAPMTILLGLMYLVQYQLIDGEGDGIQFAPLAVIHGFEPSRLWILLKFLLSILFPLAVYLIYGRRAKDRLDLNLAWLTFFAGAAQMYLLAEEGLRMGSGNFFWGAQIALFVLFTFSTIFWLRRFRDAPRWRFWLCLALFALHLVSGGVWYLANYLPDWIGMYL